jgi:hypothetical protein
MYTQPHTSHCFVLPGSLEKMMSDLGVVWDMKYSVRPNWKGIIWRQSDLVMAASLLERAVKEEVRSQGKANTLAKESISRAICLCRSLT